MVKTLTFTVGKWAMYLVPIALQIVFQNPNVYLRIQIYELYYTRVVVYIRGDMSASELVPKLFRIGVMVLVRYYTCLYRVIFLSLNTML